MTKHKKHRPLTQAELWKLLCRQPLSPVWQQRLDRLYDKIDRYFAEPIAKERAGKKKISRKTEKRSMEGL